MSDGPMRDDGAGRGPRGGPVAPWVRRLSAEGSPPRPAAEPATIARAHAGLGAGPVGWAAEHADGLVRALPGADHDAPRVAHARRGWETELLSLLLQLHDTTGADELAVSAALIDEARATARRGDAAVDVVDGVRRLHLCVQDALLTAAATETGPAPARVRRDLRLLADHSERATRALLEAFEVERVVWGDESIGRRTELLTRVVAGGAVTAHDERAAGGGLDGHHLVVLVAEPPHGGGLCALLRDASALLGAPPVATSADEAVVWWWSRPTDVDPGVLRDLAVAAGTGVAVGTSQHGPGGIARSLADARRALTVVAARGDGVVLAEETLIAASLLAEPAAGHRLVARELAGVLGLDARSADLRRTVLAHLRSGGSRQAVAAELRIAPTTVAYRVERFEQLRDRPLSASRLETWVALDLVERAPALLAALSGSEG